MTTPNDHRPLAMFKHEILNVFTRWSEESDLSVTDMIHGTVDIINRMHGDNEGTVEFEPDQEFLDKLNEEDE